MRGAEFDAWSVGSVRGFADQQVASGLLPPEEAQAVAEQAFAEQLPAGLETPEHHLWTVHADGPTVGHLWVRVRPSADEVEAFVYDVELLPQARGRGLGRATMLAAEDAARDLGATVVRLNVFGHNTVAIGLYSSLGYQVSAATMTCRLDGRAGVVPEGPAVELRDMSREEYLVFRPRLEAEYAANLARSGALTAADARRKAADDLAALLPSGRNSPGHLLWTAHDGQQPVGLLWVHLRERSDGLHAFGYELRVEEGLREHGYGRAVVDAALEECRRRGVRSVGLSVFGFNAGARRIYERVGFELTAQTMAKQL